MKFNIRFKQVWLVVCLLLTASIVSAQVNTGSLSGLVVDSSGAAVAGTELAVTSADTGYSRTSKSLGDGAYSLADLPIGEYSLTATADGFSQIQEKVRIGVGERTGSTCISRSGRRARRSR